MPLRWAPQPPVSLLLFLQSAPPRRTFDAFVEDCNLCGFPWWCAAAQQFCVALMIRNPLVKKYPPRPSNTYAFLKHYITELEAVHNGREIPERLDDEDAVQQDLMEAYIEHMAYSEQSDQRSFCYRTYFIPDSRSKYVSVRLAVGQFSNVGLALWPSAFVLVQLLAQELSESTPALLPPPLEGELRLLELGAGVGLLPLLLKHKRAYKDRVYCCVLTEYQQELIDNITFNLMLQDLKVSDGGALEIHDGDGPIHAVRLLDWTEHDLNRAKLQGWGCNLIVASDCVYDVSLIQPFVRTLYDALCAVSGDGVALVVQTHRQRETIRKLFSALKDMGLSVHSYRLSSRRTNTTPLVNAVVEFQTSVPTHSETSGARYFTLERDEVNPSGDFQGLEGVVCSPVSGWLGPFFASMEAVIGVHVIRLKSKG